MLSAGVTQEGFLEEEALLHTQLLQTLPVLPMLFFTMKNQKEKLRNQSHSPLQQKELNIYE